MPDAGARPASSSCVTPACISGALGGIQNPQPVDSESHGGSALDESDHERIGSRETPVACSGPLDMHTLEARGLEQCEIQ
jgi:hypothetical protein